MVGITRIVIARVQILASENRVDVVERSVKEQRYCPVGADRQVALERQREALVFNRPS